MKQSTSSGLLSRPLTETDVGEIAEIVNRAVDQPSACNRFAELLATYGLCLVFYGQYHMRSQRPARTHFSGLSDKLTDMCAWFDKATGCPVVRHAIATQAVFEARSVAYPEGEDFLTKRYLHEFFGMPFAQIAVATINADGWSHVFIIGVNAQRLERSVRSLLSAMTGNYVTAALVRFADRQSRQPSRAGLLLERETDCLLWWARGKSSAEIATIIGMPEHAINRVMATICRKLGAPNRANAIAKALLQGCISVDDLRSPTRLHAVSTGE